MSCEFRIVWGCVDAESSSAEQSKKRIVLIRPNNNLAFLVHGAISCVYSGGVELWHIKHNKEREKVF